MSEPLSTFFNDLPLITHPVAHFTWYESPNATQCAHRRS